MWSSGPNYTKLKTNLRLAQNRLKLLEKKKTELAQKSRKEIADYIAAGKVERARIRVEHIIREDFLVEAMEIVEMFCDLLLARFGLITQMKELDDGISEAVASLIWVTPRLQADVQELKVVSDVFAIKYGKPLVQAVIDGQGDLKPSDKLVHKLAIQAPPKLLVEKYLIEIAKVYNIEYEPDPQVMSQRDGVLIDLSGGPGGAVPPAPGFMGYPQPPVFPSMPVMPTPPSSVPFNYPPPGGNSGGGGGFGASSLPTAPAPEVSARQYPRLYGEKPKPADQGTSSEMDDAVAKFLSEEKSDVGPPPSYDSLPSDSVPDLPSIPTDLPDVPQDPAEPTQSDDIDFDDLSRRFEALKKKK
ncbi:IST1 homolog isoform X2 [Culicoides brevitarsis]|uniref:IST1 homolog isoform X2 n=1 Tax=Culicoides brevitarsis TaxID=469753 RepID=UPI00307BA91F